MVRELKSHRRGPQITGIGPYDPNLAPKPPGKWRGWWAVAAVALVVMLGAGVWWQQGTSVPSVVSQGSTDAPPVSATNEVVETLEEPAMPDLPFGMATGLTVGGETEAAVQYGSVRIVATAQDYAQEYLAKTAKRIRVDTNRWAEVAMLPHTLSNQPCGLMEVALEAAGFKADPASRSVLIQADRTNDVNFTLVSLPASLTVTCAATGVIAQIGNLKSPIVNPLPVPSLQPVTMTITTPDHRIQTLKLGPFDPLTTNKQVVTMEQESGALRIEATVPTNAQAYFQGLEKRVMIFSNDWKTVETLPYVVHTLPCMDIPVDLVAPGFVVVGMSCSSGESSGTFVKSRTARVRDAKTNTVIFQLNPLPAKLSVLSNIKGKIAAPEQVRARHIFIAIDVLDTETIKNEKKARAEKILSELTAGADFGALAKEYSDCPSKEQGGDLGVFGRGQMVKPFEDAAFALPVNQLSGVVETPFGYHIIQVLQREGGGQSEGVEAPALTVKCEPPWLGFSDGNPQSVPSLQPLTVTVSATGYVAQVVKLGPMEPGKAYRQVVKLEPVPVAAAAGQNSLGLDFVEIPWLDCRFSKIETRVKDYEVFAKETNREWPKPDFKQGPDHPAVNVSWDDATAFCTWLTGRERQAGRINANEVYRLPTDWEWSVAVGLNESKEGTPKSKDGKTPNVYPWGRQWPPPSGAGNYDQSLNVDKYQNTSQVGSFAASKHGLYDMGGNVWEWCEDFYDGQSGSRVVRGASWYSSPPGYLLSSSRRYIHWGLNDYVGFRVVLSPNSATGTNDNYGLSATGANDNIDLDTLLDDIGK